MGTENIEKSNYQKSSPKSNDEVATIPLTIDENNVLEGAREILKIIRPTWNDDNIKFKVKNTVFFVCNIKHYVTINIMNNAISF